MPETMLANQWLLIIAFVIAVAGITFCWFGGLMAALTALGNKRWIWGICALILGPLAGFPYSLIYKEADYPRVLMIRGFMALAAAILIVGIVWLLSLR